MARPGDHGGIAGDACADCPLGHGTGTSFFERTGLRSLSQSTSALLWGMAGDRGNKRALRSASCQLYLVGVNNLAKSKLSGAPSARAARRPAANGMDGPGRVERQQPEG